MDVPKRRMPWVVAVLEYVCGPGAANHAGRRVTTAAVFPSAAVFSEWCKGHVERGGRERLVKIVCGDPRGAGAGPADWDMAEHGVYLAGDVSDLAATGILYCPPLNAADHAHQTPSE